MLSNDFLFDKECRELEAILKETLDEKTIRTFKRKMKGRKIQRKLYKEEIELDKKLKQFERKQLKKFKDKIESIDAIKKWNESKEMLKNLNNTYNIEALQKAIDQYNDVKYLKYNMTFTDNNISILQLAVKWKHPSIVAYLVENGANVNYLSGTKYQQSILSYLVMCNTEMGLVYSVSLSRIRLAKIMRILSAKKITHDTKLIQNDTLNIFAINTNPQLVKDIWYQLNVNDSFDNVEDVYKYPVSCKQLDITKLLKGILNVNDCIFIRDFIKKYKSYDVLLNALEQLWDYWDKKVEEMVKTEKNLRSISTSPNDIERALEISNKAGIFLKNNQQFEMALTGHFPNILKLFLIESNVILSMDVASMCLEGISSYEMSIQTAYDKLSILFKYADSVIDGPIFNTLRPDKEDVLDNILSISSGMGLEGANKALYDKWFEKIIRLIMEYDNTKEVFETSAFVSYQPIRQFLKQTSKDKRIIPHERILQFIKLFSPQLLIDVYSFVDGSGFKEAYQYVLEYSKNNYSETVNTYFNLIKGTVQMKKSNVFLKF